MTVKELINALSKIEDKDSIVEIVSDDINKPSLYPYSCIENEYHRTYIYCE